MGRPRAAALAAAAAAVCAVSLLSGCDSDSGADPAPPPATAAPPVTSGPAATSRPAGPSGSAGPTRPSGRPGEVRAVATGLEAPWALAFLPNGDALVTERDSARILRVTATGTVSEVQRLSEVDGGGEGGLLGIAVSPNFRTDNWVYVYYTAGSENRIARLRLGQSPQPIVTGIPAAGIHNGGRIAFGPDGMLYAGTGDAAGRDRSQDVGNLGGKILRMTPEGRPAPGNPFPGSLVYSYGHRNVQGLAWDSGRRLWASEFGQNRFDEVNLIQAGRNYGWPEVEGQSDRSEFERPQVTWSTSEASPSGVAILADQIYVAGLGGRRLWRVPLDGGRAGNPTALLVDEYGRLRHVAVAPDGALWLLTSNRDGRGSPAPDDDRILRLVP